MDHRSKHRRGKGTIWPLGHMAPRAPRRHPRRQGAAPGTGHQPRHGQTLPEASTASRRPIPNGKQSCGARQSPLRGPLRLRSARLSFTSAWHHGPTLDHDAQAGPRHGASQHALNQDYEGNPCHHRSKPGPEKQSPCRPSPGRLRRWNLDRAPPVSVDGHHPTGIVGALRLRLRCPPPPSGRAV